MPYPGPRPSGYPPNLPWPPQDNSTYDPGLPPADKVVPADSGTGNPTTESPAQKWLREVIRAHPEKYDTGISDDVWLSWYPQWDDGKKKFKTQKTDGPNGQTFSGDSSYVDKPTDCPEGLQAFGDNACVSATDPRIAASQKGAPAPTTAPTSTEGTPTNQLGYDSGNPLQDALAYLFNTRAGIFGTGNYLASGATPRTGIGTAATDKAYATPDPAIEGEFLPGGGLWWGDKGTISPLAQALATSGVAPTATPAPSNAIPVKADVTTQPTGNPPQMQPFDLYNQIPKKKASLSPLTQALMNLG